MSYLYTGAKYLAGAGATIASLSAGALYYYQTSLIYPSNFPEGSRTDVFTPIKFDMPYEDVDLTTPDGVKIKGYMILAAKDSKRRPTVIMYHANAGNMGHRLPLAKVFWKQMNCNVFCLSYRGYGLSEGTPSQKGLCIDAVTALDYVLAHSVVGKSKIILYGQSIGGAVCLEVAARRPEAISAVVIENTFYSLTSMIPYVLPALKPFLMVPGLLTERWDSYLAMAKIPAKTPILMLAGLQDKLVHPSQMPALKATRDQHGGKYTWKEYAEGDHNNTCMAKGYWDDVAAFVKTVM